MPSWSSSSSPKVITITIFNITIILITQDDHHDRRQQCYNLYETIVYIIPVFLLTAVLTIIFKWIGCFCADNMNMNRLTNNHLVFWDRAGQDQHNRRGQQHGNIEIAMNKQMYQLRKKGLWICWRTLENGSVQSSYLSQISQIIFVKKKLSRGEILGNFRENLGNF